MQPDGDSVPCSGKRRAELLVYIYVTEPCTTHPNPMLGQQLQQDFEELLSR
jgi:hypothetical protein